MLKVEVACVPPNIWSKAKVDNVKARPKYMMK